MMERWLWWWRYGSTAAPSLSTIPGAGRSRLASCWVKTWETTVSMPWGRSVLSVSDKWRCTSLACFNDSIGVVMGGGVIYRLAFQSHVDARCYMLREKSPHDSSAPNVCASEQDISIMSTDSWLVSHSAGRHRPKHGKGFTVPSTSGPSPPPPKPNDLLVNANETNVSVRNLNGGLPLLDVTIPLAWEMRWETPAWRVRSHQKSPINPCAVITPDISLQLTWGQRKLCQHIIAFYHFCRL